MPKIEAKIEKIAVAVSVLIAVALLFFGYFSLGVGSIDDLFLQCPYSDCAYCGFGLC